MDEEGNLLASFRGSGEDMNLPAASFTDSKDFKSSEQEDNRQVTSCKNSVQDMNLPGSFRGLKNLPDSFRGSQNLPDSFRGSQNLPDSFWGSGQMQEQVNSFRNSDAEGNDLFPSWKGPGSEQVTL